MDDSHSTLREGAIAGAIGAAVIAIWYFILDMLAGRPLYTPNRIAEHLFGVGSSDAGNLGIIAVVTVVHFTFFAVAGVILTALVHLATNYIAWRMGVLLAFVIGLGFFTGLGYAAGINAPQPVPFWKAFGGGLVGIVAMGVYLWNAHPALARSFAEVPLGDETDSVPHAPER